MSDTSTTPPKVRIPKLNRPDRTWDFSLTLPGMISAVGAGILALTFFFVMGILIGRGYRPETDVPPLGQFMPRSEHGQLAAEAEKPTILQAVELEYPERLKASPDKIMDTHPMEMTLKPVAQTPPAQAPAQQAQATQPATQPATQSAQTQSAPVQPTPTPAAPAPTTSQGGDPVFDYIYQVASFRQKDMAQGLATKLAGAGLKTGVESGEVSGATWHRVQVFHQGTAASTENMRAVLAKFGIDKPLL
ncbi:SPOR domain-containing protein, partial [Pseudodesulfovibrio aespoeensis]